ncbi:MAG: peptidase MA family metallohydrolase [bacterium]|jgi:hypothetical protein
MRATIIKYQSCSAWALLWIAILGASIATADRGADGEYDERRSSHFTLYQDVDIDQTSGFYGSRRFELQVLDVLEGGYRNLESSLGMRPRKNIIVTIHDPKIFDRRFAGLFRFPAAGFYGGTIHIRGDTAVTDRLVRVLYHELVHAAFDAELPNTALPAWFNEGIAEWFEASATGQYKLSERQKQALASRAREGKLFSLSELSGTNLAYLGPNAAGVAYLESYGFINYLVRERGEPRLRDLCRQLIRTGDLLDSLRRIYRSDLQKLEDGYMTALRATPR